MFSGTVDCEPDQLGGQLTFQEGVTLRMTGWAQRNADLLGMGEHPTMNVRITIIRLVELGLPIDAKFAALA